MKADEVEPTMPEPEVSSRGPETSNDEKESSPRAKFVETLTRCSAFMISHDVEDVGDEALAHEGEDEAFTIDCGATGTLMSVCNLERATELGLVSVLEVRPENRKRYRVANGNNIVSSSEVLVRLEQYPEIIVFVIDAIEEQPGQRIPSLLGNECVKRCKSAPAAWSTFPQGKRDSVNKKKQWTLVIAPET